MKNYRKSARWCRFQLPIPHARWQSSSLPKQKNVLLKCSLSLIIVTIWSLILIPYGACAMTISSLLRFYTKTTSTSRVYKKKSCFKYPPKKYSIFQSHWWACVFEKGKGRATNILELLSRAVLCMGTISWARIQTRHVSRSNIAPSFAYSFFFLFRVLIHIPRVVALVQFSDMVFLIRCWRKLISYYCYLTA